MKNNFVHFKNSLDRIYCSMRYHQANNMLSITWKGTASEESIKAVEASILEMISKNKCSSILSDVQDFFTAPTGILAGLTESEWDKEVYWLGVRRIAHVLKPDMDLPPPMLKGPDKLEISFFSEKMTALEWINQYTEA